MTSPDRAGQISGHEDSDAERLPPRRSLMVPEVAPADDEDDEYEPF